MSRHYTRGGWSIFLGVPGEDSVPAGVAPYVHIVTCSSAGMRKAAKHAAAALLSYIRTRTSRSQRGSTPPLSLSCLGGTTAPLRFRSFPFRKPSTPIPARSVTITMAPSDLLAPRRGHVLAPATVHRSKEPGGTPMRVYSSYAAVPTTDKAKWATQTERHGSTWSGGSISNGSCPFNHTGVAGQPQAFLKPLSRVTSASRHACHLRQSTAKACVFAALRHREFVRHTSCMVGPSCGLSPTAS